jgi:hypothetical protein
MKRTLIACTFVFVAGLSLGPELLLAHHGRGNAYDTDQVLEIEGTISEVAWRNPHITIYIDTTDADGNAETWVIEHSNISQLARLGYGRNSLPVGTEVTARFNPGTGGNKIGLCQGFTLPDGTEIFLRSRLPQAERRGARGLRPGEVID